MKDCVKNEVRVSYVMPSCCAECDLFHNEHTNTPYDGENWELYCEADPDGNLELDDPLHKLPEYGCPKRILAEIYNVKIPKCLCDDCLSEVLVIEDDIFSRNRL